MGILLSLIAAGILVFGLGSARNRYFLKKAYYLAQSTAESVYNLITVGEDIPEEMNGFEIEVLGENRVRVGRWIFEFEVVR